MEQGIPSSFGAGWGLCTWDFSTKSLDFSELAQAPFPGDFPGCSPILQIPGCLSLSGCVWPCVWLVLFHSSSRKIHPSSPDPRQNCSSDSSGGELWKFLYMDMSRSTEKSRCQWFNWLSLLFSAESDKKPRDPWWCNSPYLWSWNLWDWRSRALIHSAGNDLMAGRMLWDAEILHWRGFFWTLGD